MLLMLFVGCGKEVAVEEPTPPTSEVVSEVVSEEVSEIVSEEPSEVVSEEVSEEPEIVDGVQKVYCENYEELYASLKDVDEPVVVVFDFFSPEKGQSILYNGAHYTIERDFLMDVTTTDKVVKKIYSTAENVMIFDYSENGICEWGVSLDFTGTDVEIPIIIVYEDGSEETITVYITKEWEG